jgi:hypothetical protein
LTDSPDVVTVTESDFVWLNESVIVAAHEPAATPVTVNVEPDTATVAMPAHAVPVLLKAPV